MKRLELKRISDSLLCTMGVLLDTQTGLPLMVTLELPDLDNQQRISCAKPGIYRVVPYSSEKYKSAFHIQDVPGRSKILIHTGNTVSDIKGCVLVGANYGTYKGKPAVLSSRASLSILKEYVDGEEFELLITRS